MGGAVSAGVDNDDLTDNLREASYIRTPAVERVFLAVDRGEYILPEYRINAYKDQAWRSNHLHLSAPCIYCEVMEGLCLSPGISFLNLGSGTGYLNTMAGLIIGSNGINHGVEFYDDVIMYANTKLENFKRYSGAIDEFDFCEPKFIQGNCLCLTNDRQYDRVYVGAACPEAYDSYMKNLLRVGGILVMPFNEQLLQIKRTSKYTWETCSLLSVSFAKLIIPKDGCKETLDLMEIEPQSLQSICRSTIRNILRENIDTELPEMKNRKQSSPVSQNKRTKVPYINNVIYEPNDSESEHDVREYLGLALDLVVGERPTRVIRRRMNQNYFNTWITDEEYETDDSSDDEAKMDSVSQSAESNATQAVQQEPVQEQEEMETTVASVESGSLPKQTVGPGDARQNRQKLDSGLGDESQSDDVMSYQGDNEENDCDKGWTWFDSTQRRSTGLAGCSMRRIEEKCIDYQNNSSSSTSENDEVAEEEEENPIIVDVNDRRTVESPYTLHMFNKIHELPLPPILKDYLNFYRV